MKFAIIGSGAMGSLFGGLLARAGHKVTLIDIWEEHVKAINESGLTLSTTDNDSEIEITATTDPTTVTTPDTVIVFVKSIHTDTALDDARTLLTSDVDVLTLQNGLGNPETIADFVQAENVIAGVTAHGATLKGPGHVFHAGTGPTSIGRYFTENDTGVQRVANTLSESGIKTDVSETIQEDIWEKVLVNIGINAPTALARVHNRTLASTPAGRRLVKKAVTEAVAVAEAEGHAVRSDIVDHVLDIAQKTGENKSSMLQDIEAGRQTEIERISGAVVERAQQHDIATPVNQTLTDLVRLTNSETDSK